MIKNLKIYKGIRNFNTQKRIKLVSGVLSLTMLFCVTGCSGIYIVTPAETTTVAQGEHNITHFATNEHIFSEKIDDVNTIIYAHEEDLVDEFLYDVYAIPEYYEIIKVDFDRITFSYTRLIITYRNTEPVVVVGKYDTYTKTMTYDDFGQRENMAIGETTTAYQKTKN